MNTSSSFNLDAAIQQWRNAISQSGSCRGESIEELESHLRDSIAALHQRGLSEEEAFFIATRRLGPPSAIETEFAKVNRPALLTSRLGWMIAGIGMYLVISELGRVASRAAMFVGDRLISGGTALGFAALAVHVFTVATAVFAVACVLFLTAKPASGWTIHLQRRPFLSATAFAVMLLGLRASETLLTAASARVMTPSKLTQTWFVSVSYGQFVPVLLLIALGFIGFLIVRKSSQNRASRSVLLLPLLMFLMVSTGCNRPSSAAPESSSGIAPAQQTQTAFEQCLALWAAGKEKEAVEKFLAIDWAKERPFSTGSALAYSEPQFVALPNEVREKLSQPLLDDLSKIKALCRRVKEDGDKARAAGETEKAKTHFEQLAKCGSTLSSPDSLLIVQMVGKAIQRIAVPGN